MGEHDEDRHKGPSNEDSVEEVLNHMLQRSTEMRSTEEYQEEADDVFCSYREEGI